MTLRRITECKTKIVATLGPATTTPEKIEALVKAGVDIFRINFSHGTENEHSEIIERIKQITGRFDFPVAILQDLQGPKIRLGKIKNGKAVLNRGAEFILTTKEIIGDEHIASITFPAVIKDVSPGEIIYINDGLIKLKIERIDKENIYTKVIEGGEISDHKGVNFPNTRLSVPAITEKDKKDLQFGLKHGVDLVALSFVKSPDEVEELRNLMKKYGRVVPIISKIEKWEAVENLESIVEVSDGIMVARGDLGVEMPIEQVPIIQKKIISMSNRKGKPVITATQMLNSMIENPTPTRAEVTDIANAIFDGTDAVMLSNETAVGKFPVESVSVMRRVIKNTEKSTIFKRFLKSKKDKIEGNSISEAIALSANKIAENVNAKVIITATESGRTALLVSKYKPDVPVIAITPREQTLKYLTLKWGVIPVKVKAFKTVDEILEKAVKIVKEKGIAKSGDAVVITAGSHTGISGSTDLLKVATVKN
ncbi:MAG: pyruvate kinase [Caldisericaceae bacterium]|nr:pyruvate kinase [Caldisericaceae bacterium]